MDLVQVENKLKSIFTEYIQHRIQGKEALDAACDTKILDLNFIFGIAEHQELAADILFEYIFGAEALDWINWWLYEKNGSLSNSPLEAYDEDNNIIPTDTIDDLWNLIKEFYVDRQKEMENSKCKNH